MKKYYRILFGSEKKDYVRNVILRRHEGDPAIMGYVGNNPFFVMLRKVVKGLKYYKIMNDNKFYIGNLAVVTGFDCNLNCKGCAQHTPQIKKIPAECKQIDMEQVYKDLDKISAAVDGIGGIALAIGEGFKNPNAEALVDYFSKNKKILNMNIPTNGGVIPAQSILKKMKKYNVSATITKYDVIPEEKRKKVISAFDEAGVTYTVFENRIWYSHEYLPDVSVSEEEAKAKYPTCEKFFMLISGKLWKCEVDATRVFAGIREEKPGESICVKDATIEEIREFLWEKSNAPYLESCLHCRSCSRSLSKEIPAGKQIENE